MARSRSCPALKAVSNKIGFFRGKRGAGVTIDALSQSARNLPVRDGKVTNSEVPQPGAGVPMMIHSETP